MTASFAASAAEFGRQTTQINVLTKSDVVASPRMFATLDPTIRSVTLPTKRKVLFSDTVGFIRHLPHTLVSAFRATLEEVQRATLILQVSDASSPITAEQDAQVESVLKELEADKKPRLHVMNKVDLLLPKQRESLRDDEHTVHVSAAKGIGLSTLLDRIDDLLDEDRPTKVRLRIPQKEGKALARQYDQGPFTADVKLRGRPFEETLHTSPLATTNIKRSVAPIAPGATLESAPVRLRGAECSLSRYQSSRLCKLQRSSVANAGSAESLRE